MSEAKPNPATSPLLRLMPSFADVAFLIPLAFLFTRLGGVQSLLGDGDTGWHIRTGEWILAHRQVPHEDLFSFTMPGHPWFAWEWLWDVAFGWLHLHWGMGAVLLASLVVICITFGLLYRVALRSCGHPVVAIAITVLAAAASVIHWLARPHLFSLLFVVLFIAVIQRVREGRTRLLLWLPLLTMVWTNLHGGFLAGIIILSAYGAGELARALIAAGAEERHSAARAAVPYLATAAGCAAASLVNPYFYHLHVHIWRYLRDPGLATIIEFQGTNFQDGAMGFFEVLLGLGLGAAIWYGSRKNFAEALLLLGWAHMALLVVRNVPVFALVAAPLVARAMVEWIRALREAPVAARIRGAAEELESLGAEFAPMERLGRTHAISAVAVAAIAVGIASPSAGVMLRPEYDPKTYPAGALALLNPDQRIYTTDAWGGYLIYRLAPAGIKVFVDGRSDFYGPEFGREYLDLLRGKFNWEQILGRYGVDTVLLPVNSPLATTIKESQNWRVVYDDHSAILFRVTAGAGQQVSIGHAGGEERDLPITFHDNVPLGGHVLQRSEL